MKPTKPELSEHYYWENFDYVLSYVAKFYSELLKEREINWLEEYQSLGFSSQCLYLRLLSRKDQWFLSQKIHYSEISPLNSALEELLKKGFLVKWPNPLLQDILVYDSLTKPDLLKLFKTLRPNDLIKSSVSLEDLKDLIGTIPSQDLAIYFESQNYEWVIPQYKDLYKFFQFLFFGSKNKDLTEFVVRDLGHRQYYEVDQKDWKPYFTNREDIEHKWKMSEFSHWFYSEKDSWEDGDYLLQAWKEEILSLQDVLSDFTYGYFERIGMQLGRWLERIGEVENALMVYEKLLSTDAFERRVRIHHKRKEFDQSVFLAEMGLALSNSPKSKHFFEDYLEKDRNKNSRKKVTDKLKDSDLVEIPHEFEGRVEQGVAEYYESQGYHAFFVENRLWKAIMGLWGWDLLFNPSNSGFHHPFQMGPSHLRSELFSMEIRGQLLNLLDSTKSKATLLKIIHKNNKEHQGKLNPFVDWNSLDIELMERFIQVVSLKSLKQITQLFWENLAAHSKGFPDLVVFSENWKKVFFVEVKSPNDHLSAVQYFWNEELNKSGISAKILRVKWLK
ncbi:MAG: DNA-directed polymerase [Bacteroidota bacterium]